MADSVPAYGYSSYLPQGLWGLFPGRRAAPPQNEAAQQEESEEETGNDGLGDDGSEDDNSSTYGYTDVEISPRPWVTSHSQIPKITPDVDVPTPSPPKAPSQTPKPEATVPVEVLTRPSKSPHFHYQPPNRVADDIDAQYATPSPALPQNESPSRSADSTEASGEKIKPRLHESLPRVTTSQGIASESETGLPELLARLSSQQTKISETKSGLKRSSPAISRKSAPSKELWQTIPSSPLAALSRTAYVTYPL